MEKTYIVDGKTLNSLIENRVAIILKEIRDNPPEELIPALELMHGKWHELKKIFESHCSLSFEELETWANEQSQADDYYTDILAVLIYRKAIEESGNICTKNV